MLIRCSELEEVVLICEAIRERASKTSPSSWRVYYAMGFFDKATLHGRSLVSRVNLFRREKHPLDISGICALSRCILEVHNASSYLLEPGISKDELELRHRLFVLNHSADLRKINQGFGIGTMTLEAHSIMWRFSGQKESSRRIPSSKHWMILTEKRYLKARRLI